MEFVSSIPELRDNLLTLEGYESSSSPREREFHANLIKSGTCFVHYSKDGLDRFAPSRFLGYRANTLADHEANAQKDGRDTNQAISSILKRQPEGDPELEDRYGAYCRRLGFEPAKSGSFGVQRKYWRMEPADMKQNALSPVEQAQRDYLQEPWYFENWLPRYRETIEEAKSRVASGNFEAILPRLWSERDNNVSSAGQGTMSRADFERNQVFLAQLTREIAADPSPAQFDRATVALKERVAAGQLKWFPRLILARVFAALAPNRYHTTVDERKHEQVIDWFEKHSPFRAPEGNWATRASALTAFLDKLVPAFPDSLTRNMFPWFVFERISRTSSGPGVGDQADGAPRDETVRVHPSRAQNVIFYGPPGTGKTRRVLELLSDARYAQADADDIEDLRRAAIAEATWMQVATAALADGKSRSVAQILDDPTVRLFVELVSRTKTPANTMWGTLQAHTVDISTTVKFTNRVAPQIFDKDAESRWRIVVPNWRDLDPDLAAAVQALRDPKSASVKAAPRVELVTFHPSYSYEEFVEGLRPVVSSGDGDEGRVAFAVRDGVFKRVCAEAHRNPAARFALVIDEINRANIAKVFGELITLIEDDKRVVPGAAAGTGSGVWVRLPASGDLFGVPSNLDLYGTMNTADRSIALLDVALRRRFDFDPIYAEPAVLRHTDDGVDLSRLLETINLRLEYFLDRDHTIGHGYFKHVHDLASLRDVFRRKVIPLLQEYFFDDAQRIAQVLGTSHAGSAFFVERPGGLADAFHSSAREDDDQARFEVTPETEWGIEDFQSLYLKKAG